MQHRMTSRRKPAAGGKATAAQGNTVAAQGETQEPVPRMPHERDESADNQARAEPSNERLGRAAQRDAERGLVDTSKGVELDATYDKVREGTAEPRKKFRP